jgi:nitroreductase
MVSYALRVPDHGRLHPWRFLIIDGDSRQRLGDLFANGLRRRKPDASAEEVDKAREAPQRAPTIITVIATIKEHPKVPAAEQTLSAGCAAHALLLAAQAMGFGAIWRTGDNSYDPFIHQGLGLMSNEHIVGYVYVGTPLAQAKPLPALDPLDFIQRW